MNDEYLWNKTGTDADIERLEKALQAFRFEPSEPPALPAKVMPLPERRSFSFFKLGFALAFAAALIVVVSIVWRWTPANHSDRRNEFAKTNGSQSNSPAPSPVASGTPIMDPSMPKPAVIRFKQPSTTATRAVRFTAKKSDKLTPEEKHAYDQLMLALAITSNELKIVKDKINGRDERTAADDRQK
jgi:hypothetical protein